MKPIEISYYDKSRVDKDRVGKIKAFQHGKEVHFVHNTPFGIKEKMTLPLREFGVFLNMLSKAEID